MTDTPLIDQLKKIDEKLDAFRGEMEPHVDRLGTRLDKVEGRLDKVEGRLEKVEGRLEKVEGRLEKVEGRLEKVEGRLDKVEISIEGLRDDVRLIAEGHLATQDLINRRADELVELLSRRVEPLEAAVRHHSGVLSHHNLTAGSSQ